MAGKSLNFSQTIEAPLEQVYYAVSTSTGFHEWFCKVAEVDLKKMKFISLWFETSYHVGGSVLKAEPNQEVTFTWHGTGDPHPTEVQILLDEQGDNVVLTIEHRGFDANPAWGQQIEAIKELWEIGVRAIKAVLETGLNPYVYEKPMLGILVGDMVDPAMAAKKNLAIDYGLILSGVLSGMGAEAAGLRQGDLMAEIDGIKIKELENISEAMTPHVAGDQLEVVYYRGEQREVVHFPVTTYPIPEVPATAQGLSEAVGAIYDNANAKMDELFSGVSEMQAEYRLKQGAWNSKEAIAHLLLSEREMYTWVGSLLTKREIHLYTSALTPRVKSVVAAYPGLSDLRGGLVKNQQEGVALLSELPAEFVARKSSFTRVAAGMLLETPTHYKEHLDQISTTLAAAEEIN